MQKWESGVALPDLSNLTAMAKKFGVSLDTLLLDSNTRTIEELSFEKEFSPEYSSMHGWELYSEQLDVEYVQCLEEGLDIREHKALIDAVSKLPRGKYKEKLSNVIFDIVQSLPKTEGYPYDEPSDLEGIRSRRKAYDLSKKELSEKELFDKIHGAWMGRICGCMLGKTVEGIRTDELHPFLKETGNFPMHRYIKSTDVTDEMCDKYTFRFRDRKYADTIEFMPYDDDTNYTVLAQVVIDKYGRDFTPYDMSRAWLDLQPKNAYCSAERVAFRNFVTGFVPPLSAEYKNPYREWIGAQIRGVYFGYINPGNPALAAEMAWRDASISHIKNGIYGEMFIAAMLACAAVSDDMVAIILGGLAEIPCQSRLYKEVMELMENYKNGTPQEACFAIIHEKYNEHFWHDWTHTIPNALIVVASLLYGKEDFGKSICMAVETGFDTDCNGATVGSILGIKNGIATIGEEWTAPIHGKLQTTIFNMGIVDCEELVKNTTKHLPKQ